MIWDQIVEARSNPDKNPRRHILTELAKYAGQKDVFVSFTAGFDLEPQRIMDRKVRSAGGQNKIGINPRSKYETPIGIYTYPVDYVLEYSKQTGTLNAPFTGEGDWGYLYVLRLATENFITDESDIGPLISRLHDKAIDLLGEVQGNTLFGEAITSAKDRSDPRSKCWNLARLLADRIAGRPGYGKRAPIAWNVLMRQVGVDAYIDDKGRGIIHHNEPTQAVFFSTQAFRVVDCLATTGDKKMSRDRRETLVKEIKARKLNVNAINPLSLRNVFDNSWDVDTDDLDWIADQLEPVQKRIINETFDRWPASLTFGLDALKTMRKFGPIPSTTIIRRGTSDHDMKLADVPKWFDRQPTTKEWKDIFEEMNAQGIDPNAKLMTLKAPWVDEKFLLTTFKTQHGGRFPDVGIIQHCAEQNGIPMTDRLMEECFVRAPARMVKSFPKHEWTFPQWYRAMRTTNHMEQGLGEIIPLEVAMPILMREDRSTFMNRELLARLIREKPEFVAMWFPTHGAQVWHQNWPELVEFVAKNITVMAQRNPEFLRFGRRMDMKPDERLLRVIWRDFKLNTQFSMRTMQWALENKWITQEDFEKHLDKRLAPLVTDWENYGWGYVDDDLWVKSMLLSGEIDRITPDHIPALMRIAPDQLQYWEGRISASDAKSLFDEYPEARSNYSIVHALNSEMVYHYWSKDMLDFETMFETMKFRIIAAALQHESNSAHKLDDPYGPFAPLPMDYSNWRHYVSIDLLLEGGAFGMNAHHNLAWLLYKAYGGEFEKLQLIVERRTMEKLIHENLRMAVMTHPFGNPIPDDLLTPAQTEYMEGGLRQYAANLDDVDKHNVAVMLFSKIAKPTQAVRTEYAKLLNPLRS